MKLKKLFALVLVVVFALGMVTACGSSEEPAADGDGYNVCFVARASDDAFAAWLIDSMNAEAENYEDINLTVVSGEGDDNTENGLLEDCLTKGYDLVIVQSHDNPAQAPYVKQLVDAGIPVITTNPTTHQCDLDGSDSLDVMEGTGTVDADPMEQAAVGANRAVEELPQGANVVVLKGPSGNYHADKRRASWEENFFANRPDVNIIGEDFADWRSDKALDLMEAWVQKGTHIDAIISMNDDMAAGAIEAIRNNPEYVKEDGTTTFYAYGVDGTARACQLIDEGLLTCTALQAAADLAVMNMSYAEKVLHGEMDVTEVADYVDAPMIDSTNVADYIQMYKDNGQL